MSSKKKLMFLIAEMDSFTAGGFHNLLSVLKDIECTDMHSGLWQENA